MCMLSELFKIRPVACVVCCDHPSCFLTVIVALLANAIRTGSDGRAHSTCTSNEGMWWLDRVRRAADRARSSKRCEKSSFAGLFIGTHRQGNAIAAIVG